MTSPAYKAGVSRPRWSLRLRITVASRWLATVPALSPAREASVCAQKLMKSKLSGVPHVLEKARLLECVNIRVLCYKYSAMFHIDFESEATKNYLNIAKYSAVTLLVVVVTVALVFAAGGYDVDRKTGEIIQNGLVLTATQPVSADVYINGNDEQDPTSSRFSLPAGQYNFEFKRDGYRDWAKKVTITGSDVVWLQYPRLIPTEIKTINAQAFKDVDMVSQTPDRKYLLIHEKSDSAELTLLGTQDVESDLESVAIPASVITTELNVASTFEVIDWAQDSRTVVLEHTNGTKKELLLLDVTKPQEAVNLSTLYELAMSDLRFIDNSKDSLYAVVNSSLRKVDVGAGTISTALINDVAQYESKDGIVVALHGKKGETTISILDGDEVYKFTVMEGDAAEYIISTSIFDGERFLAVADNIQDRTFIYQKILETAKDSKGAQLLSSLRSKDTMYLSFSLNGQFVMAQSGKNVRLYDFDLEKKGAFTARQDIAADAEATWVDGFHLNLIDTESQTFFMDYDGLNSYALAEVDASLGVFYRPDIEGVYFFSTDNKGSDILKFSSLVAEAN